MQFRTVTGHLKPPDTQLLSGTILVDLHET
jgi:hypothetical protein